jgi:hypothetical protein
MLRTPHCSWVRRPSAFCQGSLSRPPRQGRHAFQPVIEALESRQTPTVTFAAQQTFAVGNLPEAVVAADFNGDGRPDLAVANQTNTVSVLLNTTPAGATTPSFAAQQIFIVGKNPWAVAAADLNGDGRPDLAIANFDDATASELVNTTAAGAGAVSFAAQQTFATGTGPFAAAAGDFNGDGRADLALANGNANSVSVLLDTTTPFVTAVPVVVGQFGGAGVWEFNRALGTWVQLTPANATLLAADPQGDVAGEFKGFGVWLFRPASDWQQIGNGDASALAMNSLGEVAGSFPGHGVWLYRPAIGFQQIGTSDAAALAMDPLGDVAGLFPGAGVWYFRLAANRQRRRLGVGDGRLGGRRRLVPRARRLAIPAGGWLPANRQRRRHRPGNRRALRRGRVVQRPRRLAVPAVARLPTDRPRRWGWTRSERCSGHSQGGASGSSTFFAAFPSAPPATPRRSPWPDRAIGAVARANNEGPFLPHLSAGAVNLH